MWASISDVQKRLFYIVFLPFSLANNLFHHFPKIFWNFRVTYIYIHCVFIYPIRALWAQLSLPKRQQTNSTTNNQSRNYKQSTKNQTNCFQNKTWRPSWELSGFSGPLGAILAPRKPQESFKSPKITENEVRGPPVEAPKLNPRIG